MIPPILPVKMIILISLGICQLNCLIGKSTHTKNKDFLTNNALPDIYIYFQSELDTEVPTLIESCSNGQVIFELKNELPYTLSFPISVSGTAQAGIDYEPFPQIVSIPEGLKKISLPLIAKADNESEDDEFIEINIVSPTVSITNEVSSSLMIQIKDGLIKPFLQDLVLCTNQELRLELHAEEDQQYKWLNTAGVRDPYQLNALFSLDSVQTIPDTIEYVLAISAEKFECIILDTMQVIVLPYTAANFTLPEQTLCQGEHIFLQNKTAPTSTYQWEWGISNNKDINIIVENEESIHYSFDTPDWYQISLSIRNEFGCLDTAVEYIKINPAPQADFYLEEVCQYDTVQLNNKSTVGNWQSIKNVRWELDESFISDDVEPKQVFTEIGERQLQLSLKSIYGCTDTVSKIVHVRPAPKWELFFESVCEGVPTELSFVPQISDSFSENTAKGLNWDWEWTIAEQLQARNSNPIYHTFTQSGNIAIELKATNTFGCRVEKIDYIEVWSKPPAPYVLGDTVCTGESALLFAEPLNWHESVNIRWYETTDVQDSISKSSIVNEGVSYETAPLFADKAFQVEMISEQGCISEGSIVSGLVAPTYQAELVLPDTFPRLPLAVIFPEVSGIPLIDEIVWKFGDGESSSEKSPAHQYKKADEFMVEASVLDTYGCLYNLKELLTIEKPTTFFIPTAFSPNDDGINDFYKIGHGVVRRFQVQIYDRYGTLHFKSTDPGFEWDGRSNNGEMLPEGVYTYLISGLDVTNLEIQETGTLTLLR